MACLDVPTNSPNCSWVIPFSSLNSLIRFFTYNLLSVKLTLLIILSIFCKVNLTENITELWNGKKSYVLFPYLFYKTQGKLFVGNKNASKH